jgi:hypothetical protein
MTAFRAVFDGCPEMVKSTLTYKPKQDPAASSATVHYPDAFERSVPWIAKIMSEAK